MSSIIQCWPWYWKEIEVLEERKDILKEHLKLARKGKMPWNPLINYNSQDYINSCEIAIERINQRITYFLNDKRHILVL